MADLLLDVTIFEDYCRGDAGARSVIDRIVKGEVSASVSPLTAFHLWSSPGLDRRTEIGYAGMLSFLEEATLTVEAAKVAGLWIAFASAEERGKLAYFAFVAATAKERSESICTRNAEPFSRFYSDILGY
jgi:hypothetical protein